MARYLQSTCSEDKLEQVGQEEILDRQLLFEKDNKVLYIKFNGELIPIGGACKQDLFQAGDNIEILDLEAKEVTDPLQEVRLKDDIDINSMRLSPEGEDVNWVGTYKLGTLSNSNLIFLLTPETPLDESKGFIGGEVFIEMVRADGLISYAHYEVTATSTGSWSLQGACEDVAEVRMVKAKWKDRYYYGLRLPKSTLVYQKVETKYREVEKSETWYEESEPQEQATSLFFQVGLPENNNGQTLALTLEEGYYGQQGAGGAYTTGTPRDIGTSRLFFGVAGYTVEKSSVLGAASSTEYWHSIPAQTIAENIANTTHGSLWQEAIENGYKFNFKVESQYIKRNTYDPDAEAQGITDLNGQGATLTSGGFNTPIYFIRNYKNGSSSSVPAGQTQANWTLCNSGIRRTLDNHLVLVSNTDSFVSFKLTDIESLYGITFGGKYRDYADKGYYLTFATYFNSTSIKVYSYAITKDYNIPVSLYTKNTSCLSDLNNGYTVEFLPSIVSDFGPLGTNSGSYGSANTLYSRGNLVQAAETYPVVDGKSDRLKIRIKEITLTPGTVTLGTVESSALCTWTATSGGQPTLVNSPKYAAMFEWYDGSNSITSASNPLPLILNDNWAFLRFGTENTVSNPSGSWSTLALSNDAYTIREEHTRTWTELEEYEEVTEEKIASAIQGARFWFNGWQTCELPTGYTDSDLTFQVLSDKSNDNDSYAGTYYYSTLEAYKDSIEGIQSLPDTGEDNAPYKIIITQEYLSMQDIQEIAEYVKHLERQVHLDLSQCKVLPDAEVWASNIFEGCASLRELSIPQGVKTLGQGIFKWCTYMRKLDLTPSQNSLTAIGGDGWESNSGFLVSTRVTTVLVPRSVRRLKQYLISASNIKNLICLHNGQVRLAVDSDYPAENTLSSTMWTWLGGSGTIYGIPEGFRLFFSRSFIEANMLYTGYNGTSFDFNASGKNWDFNNEGGWWSTEVIKTATIYPDNGTQAEWQDFNDKYHWGEELINEVRAQFGYTDRITILN